MSENQDRDYSNGEITVHWKPGKCIHSAVCVKGLHAVFNTKARPWINMQAADSGTIRKQVSQCPSGALSFSEDTK
ncbi:MAG: Iron sulfur domain-containing, CDGSH-type [Bacteroidetes bacterium]|nr:MAG: Iron sulfur domain-containing, CDGSH-type [Bacteroidota bacterium]